MFACCLLKDAGVLEDVAKVLSDLDQPDVFITGNVRAYDLCISRLAVVALAVPAVECEATVSGLCKAKE